jgi:hypothetical protein
MRLSMPVISGVVRWLKTESVPDPNAKQLAPAKLKSGREVTARLAESAAEATGLNELLGEYVGLRRLYATSRAGKLDLFFAIRDFNVAHAHELEAGRADPNGRWRRWIALSRTGHDRCCVADGDRVRLTVTA